MRNVSNFQLPKKINPVLIIIIIVVIAVLWGLGSTFFIVGQDESAVVLFFGQKKDEIVGPGLHFKLPFGIEQNLNVKTKRVFKEEFGFRTLESGVASIYSNQEFPNESIILTGDKNIVDVEWIIQYEIMDPVAWLFNVQDQHKTIRDISQSVMNQLIGDNIFKDVISTKRQEVQIKCRDKMNEILGSYKLGVRITTVALQDILPPEGEVRDAFADVNKAEQDRERFINEGFAAKNKAVEEAKGTAARIKLEAEAYALKRVNIAKGDVARFESVLTEYKKAPDVTRTRLYIEMCEQVFGSGEDTDIVDRNLKNNFIPLKSYNKLPSLSGQGGAQ